MKKRITIILLFCMLAFSNAFCQSALWDLGRGILGGVLDEILPNNNALSGAARTAITGAWDGIAQYNRVMENTNTYFEDEMQQGLRSGKYVNNLSNPDYARIHTIFNRILQSEHMGQNRQKFNWRIYLENTNSINAHASINGIVAVNKGMVNFCRNDDELAMVIGHEIAHMTEGHLKQRAAAREVRTQILNGISSYVTQNSNSISDKAMFDKIFGFAGDAALMKFSRENEEESDGVGAKYAASVGYDPTAGYDIWTRMARLSTDRTFMQQIMSSHPYAPDRANSFIAGNYKAKYYKPSYNNQNYNNQSRQDTSPALAYNNRGNEYFANGNYDNAIVQYAEANRLSPNDEVIKNNLAGAYNERGVEYYNNGDYTRAAGHFSEAVRLNPNSEVFRGNLAATNTKRSEASNNNANGENLITIVNSTGYWGYVIMIRPAGDSGWGDDLLGANTLRDGNSAQVKLPRPLNTTNRFDIAMIDSDSDWYIKRNTTITPNSSVVFTFDDFVGQ